MKVLVSINNFQANAKKKKNYIGKLIKPELKPKPHHMQQNSFNLT